MDPGQDGGGKLNSMAVLCATASLA